MIKKLIPLVAALTFSCTYNSQNLKNYNNKTHKNFSIMNENLFNYTTTKDSTFLDKALIAKNKLNKTFPHSNTINFLFYYTLPQDEKITALERQLELGITGKDSVNTSESIRVVLASDYLNKRKYKKAINVLKPVKNSYSATGISAVCYEMMGKTNKAIKQYQKAFDLSNKIESKIFFNGQRNRLIKKSLEDLRKWKKNMRLKQIY